MSCSMRSCISRMRACAWASSGPLGSLQQGVAQHAQRGLDLAAAAFPLPGGGKVSHASPEGSKYSRRSPGRWRRRTRRQACSSLSPMLTFEREKPSVSAMSSAWMGARREVNQGVDLAHGAIDAPAAAHFAEVGDEAGGQRAEGAHDGDSCAACAPIDGCLMPVNVLLKVQ